MTGAEDDPPNVRSWRRGVVFPRGGSHEEGGKLLSRLLEEFDAFAATLDGFDRAGDFRLVCDELAANALRHASPAGDVAVEFELRVGPDAARLFIRDNGPAFDSFNQPDPYLGPNVEKRRVGGLGLYLVKKLFPQARQVRDDGWNVASVECRLGKTAGGRAEGEE